MIRKILIIYFILFFILIGKVLPCHSASPTNTSVQIKDERDIQKIDKIVIFPFENISGNFRAPAVINSLLEKELQKKGFHIVKHELVDKFLSKRRIRHTGVIDRITTIDLHRELEADAVVIGSIDMYSEFNNDIYVGLTIRIIGTKDCSIAWMDSVSYAGSDFKGLLGLGRLWSLNNLSEVIVTNMAKDIPKEYLLNNRENNPFEIGNVKLSPPVLSAGKISKISVKIIPISEKPVLVQSRIGEELFILENGNGDYYEGEFKSPLVDRVYPLDIIVSASDGRVYSFSSVDVVKVDTRPPAVSISADKDITAGFAKKDAILFTLKADEDIEKWEVEIVDKKNKYVRGGKGFGTLPMQLVWRGENDEGGRNDDGLYNLKLSVWDAAGNVGFSQKEIMLDTMPPKVRINAETSDNKDVVFNIDYEKEDVIDKWEFIVTGENSEIIKNFSGRGDLEKKIVVSLPLGERTLGSRKLIYTFKAIDKAGNIFETSNQTNIFAEKKEEKFAKKNERFINNWGEGDF